MAVQIQGLNNEGRAAAADKKKRETRDALLGMSSIGGRMGGASDNRAGSSSRGPRGYRQMGEEAQSLMETRGQKIREAAKKKSALQRAGAEKGIAAQVGRSARQGGSGGRGEVLGQVGSDLSREAAATAAGAELAATDADLDAKKFEAEKYVSPTEARQLVEAYIDTIEDSYSHVFGDDEAGLANDIEAWANEKGADGRPLRSENEQRYALDQVKRLRSYEQSFWGHKGGRHIGSM